VPKCRFPACSRPMMFGSDRFCLKHACKRCDGNGKVEQVFQVFVWCPVCGGKGTTVEAAHGWSAPVASRRDEEDA
jgi:DnaJ-class molecular chaperone